MKELQFSRAGETALFVRTQDAISPENLRRITHLREQLQKAFPEVETVPSYTGFMVYYDAESIDFRRLKDHCIQYNTEEPPELAEKTIIEIPVCYGGQYGPDLEFVAAHHHLTTQQVIELHSRETYLVYMLGFTPGFPYLGGMNEQIATPRLKQPRTKIPAGSVGIAGHQTGIYPLESPGGWQLIGRTPLRLFRPERTDPFLLDAGQKLKFTPVSEEKYNTLQEEQWGY